MRPTWLVAAFSLVVLLAFGVTRAIAADEPPRSFVASSDVYNVIGENEQYRIISATWQPGQRDKLHSHGATVASYALTDCRVRTHLPDGKTADSERKAGSVSIRSTGLVHSQENIGTSVCKLIIFEPK